MFSYLHIRPYRDIHYYTSEIFVQRLKFLSWVLFELGDLIRHDKP